MWLFFLVMIIDLVDGSRWGEVLVVNKGMVSPLLSHLGWSYLHVFFRAMAHVSLYVILLYTLRGFRTQFSLWHRGVPRFCWGCIKDPRTMLLH